MSNHYHLLIETPDGNLSKGMRQLNGVFTQASNRRHQRSGHLFQGRYKAILVDADTLSDGIDTICCPQSGKSGDGGSSQEVAMEQL